MEKTFVDIGRKVEVKLRETVFRRTFSDLRSSDYLKTREKEKNLSLEQNLSLDSVSDRHRHRLSDKLSCETQIVNCDVQSLVKNDLSVTTESLEDMYIDLRNLFDEKDPNVVSIEVDDEKCVNVISSEILEKENLIDNYDSKETDIKIDGQRHLPVTKVKSSNSNSAT